MLIIYKTYLLNINLSRNDDSLEMIMRMYNFPNGRKSFNAKFLGKQFHSLPFPRNFLFTLSV